MIYNAYIPTHDLYPERAGRRISPTTARDASGRLVYFRQPAISSLAGVRRDIEQMRAHPRPRFGFGEVFEQVKLHREWPAGESRRSSALSLST